MVTHATPPSSTGIRGASGALLAAVGVLSIVAGILAFTWPETTLLVVGVTFGVLLLLVGLGDLAGALAPDATPARRVIAALLGVLTLIAGAVLIVRPGASVLTLALVLGFWFVLSGILQLAHGLAEKQGRWINLLFGALGLIAGVFITAAPGISLVTLVYVTGIVFIIRGIVAIAAAVLARSGSARAENRGSA